MPRKTEDQTCDVCEAKVGQDTSEGKPFERISRCNKCKDRFYCSKTCQKKDWKRHRYDCSMLPDEPLPPFRSRSSAQKLEVDRLQRLVAACPNKKDLMGAALQRNTAFKRLGEYIGMAYRDIPGAQLQIPLPAAQHAAISRCYLIADIASLDSDDLEGSSALIDSIVQPKSITRLYGPKVIALPDSLAVGEYLQIARVWPMILQRVDESKADKWNEMARVFGGALTQTEMEQQERKTAPEDNIEDKRGTVPLDKLMEERKPDSLDSATLSRWSWQHYIELAKAAAMLLWVIVPALWFLLGSSNEKAAASPEL